MFEDSKLLQVRSDTREYVQKMYGLDKPEKMGQAIEILAQWLKKQNHFTKKEYDRLYLEQTIYDTKGSIEKAKEKLEKRCIFRTVLPQFFEFDSIDEFKDAVEYQGVGSPLPKLTHQHYRVIAYKIYNNPYFQKTTFLEFFKFSYLIYEYLKLKDCCAGYILVVDFRDVSMMDVISKLNPMEFKHWATFLMEAQGMRLKHLVYLSNSKTIETFIRIVKPLFNKKLRERIHVFRDAEELQKLASKDVLPVEFGGTERSLKDILADWYKVLSTKEYLDYYIDIRNAKIDERIKKIDTKDNYAELVGSFVTLNFD